MAEAESRRALDLLRRRLEDMGLRVREVPGGASLLVRVPLGEAPLPAARQPGPGPAGAAVVATVGANRIKCLAPGPLFHLGLISIADCASPEAIARRIREAWSARLRDLDRTRAWLEKLGIALEAPDGDPVLAFPIGAEDGQARARSFREGRVVVPGRGPLSGLALQRAEDRELLLGSGLETSMDLELAVTSRIEELARLEARVAQQARRKAAELAPSVRDVPARRPRVLLVGPHLGRDALLAQALGVRGWEVDAAPTDAVALRVFDAKSPELVLADADLGRYEGVELVPAIRAQPGVEELSVLIVDSRHRNERRETARRVGAAGYLVRPLDLDGVSAAFVRLATRPRRRRFTRYPEVLGVRSLRSRHPERTEQVGRGGLLLVSGRDACVGSVEPLTLNLPGAGSLRVDAEVVYRVRGPGPDALGMRFHAFPEDGEDRWITWLVQLDARHRRRA